MRRWILAAALLMIAIIATLEVRKIAHSGLEPLDALSALVLALFAFGVLGALREQRGR